MKRAKKTSSFNWRSLVRGLSTLTAAKEIFV